MAISNKEKLIKNVKDLIIIILFFHFGKRMDESSKER